VTPTAAMRAWRVWLLLQPLGRRPGLPVAGTDRPARGHAGGGCETATRARWRVWTVARRVAAWRCTPALGCTVEPPPRPDGTGTGTSLARPRRRERGGERRRHRHRSASACAITSPAWGGGGRRLRSVRPPLTWHWQAAGDLRRGESPRAPYAGAARGRAAQTQQRGGTSAGEMHFACRLDATSPPCPCDGVPGWGDAAPDALRSASPNVTDRRKWALRVHARPDQVRFTRLRRRLFLGAHGWMGAEGVARGLETSCHFF
jgi:hypothetical protein